MSKQEHEPFKTLGQRLRIIRQKLHETMADVSGAVEIDENMLQRIEDGRERPSEDILMLLINHFGMHDDEAAALWQLAGYDQPRAQQESGHDQDEASSRNMVLVMAVDPRIIYSDSVQVTASQKGVVLSFSQASGTSQILTTARIGMSREQAANVLKALQQALQRSEPRQLPASGTSSAEQSDQPRPE